MTEPQKRPRGRPAVPPEQRAVHDVHLRLTAALHAKLQRLGGAAWLRERIAQARERAPQPE